MISFNFFLFEWEWTIRYYKNLAFKNNINTTNNRFIPYSFIKMKNKIQILVLSLVVIFGFCWISEAKYNLTWDELKQFNSQKVTISQASDSGLWKYYTQLAKWYNILEDDERLATVSSGLRDYAYAQFDSRKRTAKQKSVWDKSKFLDEYSGDITLQDEFPFDKCTWWYNTIDNISFANDFPTALTLAIWYRESWCGYYLPANGDGPFQIVSKDYWNGEITEEIFKQTVQDFIDFAKWKIEGYNNRSDEEFPEIKLNYTSFDYTGVVSFAALYNGWTRTGWMVQPNAPKYVFDGYGEKYANSKKFWVFPAFLKLISWELNNI